MKNIMNRSIKTLTDLAVTASVALVLLSCEAPKEGPKDGGGSSGGGETSDGGTKPGTTGECYTDKFEQPKQELSNSLDIIFVTDTSGSIDAERASIADGVDSLVAELPNGVDYRIGVMLAHSSKSGYTGRLWQHSNRPYVLDSKTMSLSTIREHLRYNLTKGPSDSYADGGELGLYAFHRGLHDADYAAIRHKGLFRDDAALLVIFVSDENDICATYPAGVKPVPDPEGMEAGAKKRDCKGISPESVLARVKELYGTRPVLMAGIVYDNLKTYPRSGENEYGYGYMDLIELSSGISMDMAGKNYNEGLASIGALVSKKLQLYSDFKLKNDNVDPASIEALVDRKKVSSSYKKDSNEVHLEDAGGPGSLIEISYCEPKCADDEDKVTICHIPPGNPKNRKTLSVGKSAVEAHLAHGDFVGSCEQDPVPTPSPTPVPTPTPEPFAINGFDAATNSNSAFLIWYTPNVPSTSQVRWGLTPQLENTTVLDSTQVQDHSVTLGGLQPNTTYYLQGVSVNASGYVSYSNVIIKTTKP